MNQSPRVLGNRYEVGDLLGRGGMAEVHLGEDTRLRRVVAIKLLRTDLARDPTFQARFRREAQSSAGLNHPAIVAVYDTGEETVVESGGSTVALPYIVMEYVEGRTLRDLLRDGKPLDVHYALEVTAGVLAALDYSHRMGIVHRDIKPANVMLTADGDVKVMDFGIARALADVSATMTQTQAVIGTAQYLSPEQARGETVDARSDLYSAGCLLYELMTGRPPFVADSPVAVAYQHVREQPHPPSAFNPVIPDVVDRIVLHALAKDREARYQTANEFRADLEAALAGRAVAAASVARSAPGQAGVGEGATEYLSPGGTGTRAYPPLGQTMSGAPPQPAGLPPGYADPSAYSGQHPGDYPGEYPGQYPDGYPGAEPDQAYSRRGQDRESGGGGGRTLGFALLAIAVVALFAGATYFVQNLVANQAANATITVPVVTGDSQAVAEGKLRASGFGVKVTTKNVNQPPKGAAVNTVPAGGTTATKSSVIELIISLGPATGQVPDVKGQSVKDAKATLRAAGFGASDINQTVDDSGLAAGLVVDTNPTIGSAAPSGTKITLKVSSGKANIPNEVGKTVNDAEADLNKAGFNKIMVVLTDVPGQTPNTVVDQDPKSGSVDTGRQVKLVVVKQPDQSPPDTSPTDSGPGNSGGGQPTDSTPPPDNTTT